MLICEAQKILIKIFSDFLAIRCQDKMQRNARIESESILVSCCIATSINAKAMQCNTLRSIL